MTYFDDNNCYCRRLAMHVVTAGPTFPVREAKSIKRSFHPDFNDNFDIDDILK